MFDYIVKYYIVNGDKVTYKDRIITVEDKVNKTIRDEIIQEYLEDWHDYKFDELIVDDIVELIDRNVNVEEFEYGVRY